MYARVHSCPAAGRSKWLGPASNHFPMQNSEKMESSTCSVSMAPVTRPSARAAARSSSHAISSCAGGLGERDIGSGSRIARALEPGTAAAAAVAAGAAGGREAHLGVCYRLVSLHGRHCLCQVVPAGLV